MLKPSRWCKLVTLLLGFFVYSRPWVFTLFERGSKDKDVCLFPSFLVWKVFFLQRIFSPFPCQECRKNLICAVQICSVESVHKKFKIERRLNKTFNIEKSFAIGGQIAVIFPGPHLLWCLTSHVSGRYFIRVK